MIAQNAAFLTNLDSRKCDDSSNTYLCRLCLQSPSQSITCGIGGANNEYIVKSIRKNFQDAKDGCKHSGNVLVTIETLIQNIDVNVVSLDFQG